MDSAAYRGGGETPTIDSLRQSLGSTQTAACSTMMQRQIGTLLRHRSYCLRRWDQGGANKFVELLTE